MPLIFTTSPLSGCPNGSSLRISKCIGSTCGGPQSHLGSCHGHKRHQRRPKTGSKTVLIEVNEITLILSQMQSFLNGDTAITKTGASLVLVEQVIVVLSGCVISFSELESVLDDLKTEGHLDTIDRMRWARKDSTITGIIQRLQKASMNPMLTILSWSALTERQS